MEKLKNNLVTIAVIFFIIAILMPIFILVLYVVPYPNSVNGVMGVDNIGSTADFLAGTMTPFLTIAAFFLLLKGYFMQKEELAQTRAEMKRSAEALDRQRKIMEEEQNLLKLQKEFDFCVNLINDLKYTFQNIKVLFSSASIDYENKIIKYSYKLDKEVSLCTFYNNICNIIILKLNEVNDWEDLEKIEQENFYGKNLKNHAEYIVHGIAFNYYSKLYYLLNYVDNEICDEHFNKKILKYLSVNLEPCEKVMLFFIMNKKCSVIEQDKMISLIRKYNEYITIDYKQLR